MKKMKVIAMLTAFALTASLATAQELPRKVSNIEILDLNGKPAKLPHFGEKNLMIFYVDPDRHKQNNDFTLELERTHRAESENIYGFGIMNLKDAPMIPNGMARNMAKKRTEKNGALVLADQERVLSTAWGAGRLQQPVRAALRLEGGRAGLPAQGRTLRTGQAGLLRRHRPVQITGWRSA